MASLPILEILDTAIRYDGYTYLRTEQTGSVWGPSHYYELTVTNTAPYKALVNPKLGGDYFPFQIDPGESWSFEVEVAEYSTTGIPLELRYSLAEVIADGWEWWSPESVIRKILVFEVP